MHQDLFEMAAALHSSFISNHPFIDGNKRTALLAALTFLDLNGFPNDFPSRMLVEITLGVAAGSVAREQVALVLRDLARGSQPGSHKTSPPLDESDD